MADSKAVRPARLPPPPPTTAVFGAPLAHLPLANLLREQLQPLAAVGRATAALVAPLHLR